MVPLVPSLREAVAKVRALIQTGPRETGSAGDVKLLQSSCMTFHQSASEREVRYCCAFQVKGLGTTVSLNALSASHILQVKGQAKNIQQTCHVTNKRRTNRHQGSPPQPFLKQHLSHCFFTDKGNGRPREQGGITQLYTPQGHDAPKNLSLETGVSCPVSHKGFHGDSVYDWGPPGRLEEEGGLAPEDVRHHHRPCPVSPQDLGAPSASPCLQPACEETFSNKKGAGWQRTERKRVLSSPTALNPTFHEKEFLPSLRSVHQEICLMSTL